jgi:hypothetical protein
MTPTPLDSYGLFGNRLPPQPPTDAVERSRAGARAQPDLLDLVKLGAERKILLDFEREAIPGELLVLLEDDLVHELDRDRRAAAARHESYKSDFATFKQYAQAQGMSYLPASPTAIACFLLHDITEAAKPGYVSRILSALAYVHELRMLANPCRTPLVRAARRSLMRMRRTFAERERIEAAGAPRGDTAGQESGTL